LSDDIRSNSELSRRARLLRPDGTPVPIEEHPANRLLRGEPLVTESYVLEREDGSHRHVIVSGSRVLDDNGQVRWR
jgi:hypothetical protein